MPIIYLSPSTQENNMYVTGGSEEQWMNRLADAMVPYLDASGIQYTRNTPDMTAVSSIRASNAGTYDLHLALHSNAAPADRYGTSGALLYSIIPAALTAAGRQCSWRIISKPSIHFLIKCGRREQPPLERCASPGPPLCF